MDLWFLFALAMFFFAVGALAGITYRRDHDRWQISCEYEAEYDARLAELRRAGFRIVEEPANG